MNNRFKGIYVLRSIIAVVFILSTITTSIISSIKPTHAAGFSMQQGYYVGSGVAGKTISGLGFQPQYIMIKSVSTQVAVIKTSTMPADSVALMSGGAFTTGTPIAFTSDGFTLGTLANVNNLNTIFYWTAFAGSDCSSTGTMCVGTYTGNGSASQTITTGFQPSLVIMRSATSTATHFRTASMPSGRTEFFNGTAANTTGADINAFSSTAFTVGLTDNASSTIFHYVAFKANSGTMKEGTYTGDGTANRNITGLGFRPDWVLIKNSSSATANNLRSVMTTKYQTSNETGYASDSVADGTNLIQSFQSDGFQIGTAGEVNESAATVYWFAFSGVPAETASGTYKMAVGTYAGSGVARSITGVGFSPSLIIIKNITTGYMVYRTSMQDGANSGYIANAAGDSGNIITSLDSDGFSLGTNATVNSASTSYHWQAFGNAYNPETKKGSADFAIGSYMSNGIATTKIFGAPYTLDFLTVKSLAATTGAFHITDQVGDLSGFYSAAGESSNVIQSIASDGFTVGSDSTVNVTGATKFNWFGFKNGANFTSGSYTGNAVNGRNLTFGSSFMPDLTWIKQSTGVNGITKPSTVAANTNQYFMNLANATTNVTAITTTGLTITNNFEVNSSGGIYRYMAWKIPPAGSLGANIVDSSGTDVASPNYPMSSISYPYLCSQSSGSLGTSSQRIRISNTTSNASWGLSIAATGGQTAKWSNSGNTGFYDFNDPSGSPPGCSDGPDADSLAGALTISPSTATITPQAGCSNTNVSLGSNQTFNESTLDSISLASASLGANTSCYWDLTNVGLTQTIPPGQFTDTYNINLTLTVVAL